MKIDSFRVINYKSYRDSGEIALSPFMNVLTGENHVGKTALLKALELRFSHSAHRSIAGNASTSQKPSEVYFTVSVPADELADMVATFSLLKFTIPPNPFGGSHPFGFHPYDPHKYFDPQELSKMWDWVLSKPAINFALVARSSTGQLQIDPQSVPSHRLYSLTKISSHHVTSDPVNLVREIQANGRSIFHASHDGQTRDLGQELAPLFVARIYRFSAERFPPGESLAGSDSRLNSNALNLAECLGTLQPNAAKYEAFLAKVRYVLPQIKWVSVVPIGSNVRVDVWNFDKELMRPELAVPLDESGTGVGQVLAILYVVSTATEPSVLLIDEPQSFLHPAAARKLIEVLREYPQHQYLISTHAPSIISAADPNEILIARNASATTEITIVDKSNGEALKKFLEEIGARLSDVFGMDRVVWVEGATEAKIFPRLMKRFKRPLSGGAVISVKNTGDFETKDAKRILEIYRNLTSKATLLPTDVTFIFDSELRTQSQMDDLSKLSEGRAYFLPKRMIENYLLDDDAIAAVLCSAEGADDLQIKSSDVKSYLEEHVTKPKYWNPESTPTTRNVENDRVNGALLLRDLFSHLSSQRVAFQKTTHSVALVDWLLTHKPDRLGSLATFLETVLGRVAQ